MFSLSNKKIKSKSIDIRVSTLNFWRPVCIIIEFFSETSIHLYHTYSTVGDRRKKYKTVEFMPKVFEFECDFDLNHFTLSRTKFSNDNLLKLFYDKSSLKKIWDTRRNIYYHTATS